MGPNKLRNNYYSLLDKVIVIAHRGASAYRPEHTLEAYKLAAEMGADVLEPDLVMTKDGHLIVRHENNITDTTNVADLVQFMDRKCVKYVDGERHEGWFSEDFTLNEIKTLRCKERIPHIRPNSAKYDGQFEIATFEEVIQLAQSLSKVHGRVIGIYPETKHPSYFRNLGLGIEEPMLKILGDYGWNTKDAPVIIQSFEVANLKNLNKICDLHLVQLINTGDLQPEDWRLNGDSRSYTDMVTFDGLKEVSRYADAIGIHKDWIIPRDTGNWMTVPSDVIKNAKLNGLLTTVWTVRPENFFLSTGHKSGPDALDSGIGDMGAELLMYLEAGIDGFFTDAADIGRQTLDKFTSRNKYRP